MNKATTSRLPQFFARCVPIVAALMLFAACSSSTDSSASAGAGPASPGADANAAKAATDAKANKDLQLYEQMRVQQSFDLATPLGDDIVKKYPGSAAASKVKETLDDVRAKAAADAQTRRLARLWAYTTQAEKGGTQYAASIESTPPLSPPGVTGADARHVHLILRQHPQWGQSVYLFLDNDKFDCKTGCPNLPISFDDEPAKPWKATIPPTGEPALFIDDDKPFIARILKTKKVTIAVVLKGGGKTTLVFETGGLDISHLPGTGKK